MQFEFTKANVLINMENFTHLLASCTRKMAKKKARRENLIELNEHNFAAAKSTLDLRKNAKCAHKI